MKGTGKSSVLSSQFSVAEHCKPITDNFWIRQNHPLNCPQPDLERRKNFLILGIVGHIERNLVKGLEVDAITVAVAEWATPQFAAHVKVIKPGRKDRGNAGVLFLECANPVYKFELSRRVAALTQKLAVTGITKVIIR